MCSILIMLLLLQQDLNPSCEQSYYEILEDIIVTESDKLIGWTILN